jgi:hypothetical protein
MEQAINTLADGLAAVINGLVSGLVLSGVAFVAFALLWLGFGAALIWSQGSLDAAWHWIRTLPLLVQGLVWLLFLPVVIGLWIWESTWPLIVRVVLIAGVAWWNLLVFLPRALQGGRP